MTENRKSIWRALAVSTKDGQARDKGIKKQSVSYLQETAQIPGIAKISLLISTHTLPFVKKIFFLDQQENITSCLPVF